MKALLTTSLVLLFAVGLVHGMDPSFGTGDRRLDSTLEQLDVAAGADPDGFIRRLSSTHGFPALELRQARDTYGLGGADLFMAAALARESHRSVYAVAEGFKQSQGKGWGVMAQDLGIRPGSAEFHRLKRDAKESLDSMNSTAKAKQKHEKTKKEAQGKSQGKSRS